MKASILAMLAITLSVFGQSTVEVENAAATVAQIRNTMLDPDSFVLDMVFVTKLDKKGYTSYCYEYRSRNRLGGYAAGRAVERPVNQERLRLTTYSANRYGATPGYDAGRFSPCKKTNIDRNITAEVSSAAKPFTRRLSE